MACPRDDLGLSHAEMGPRSLRNSPRSRKPVSLNGCLESTKRGGWRGVGRKGWQRVGEGLAEKVGEGLAENWQKRLAKG